MAEAADINIGTIIIGESDPGLSGTITEGTLDTISFWIKFSSNPFSNAIVDVTSNSLQPDFQRSDDDETVVSTGPDWDRLICHERTTKLIGDTSPLASLSHKPGQYLSTPYDQHYHAERDLSGGCPMEPYTFAPNSWNVPQKVSFMAGHDADAFDHSVIVYVRSHYHGITYPVTINIIDDDKGKPLQHAQDEYRIEGFDPHASTTYPLGTHPHIYDAQMTYVNNPPNPIQVTGMGDGIITLQWDDSYPHLWHFDVNNISVIRVNNITDGSYEITGLEQEDAYIVGVCESDMCSDELGTLRIEYVESEYTPLGLGALNVSDITKDTAHVSWGVVENADEYLIVATPTSIPPEFGTIPEGTDLSQLYVSATSYDTSGDITGLYSDTDFELYVVPIEVNDNKVVLHGLKSKTIEFRTLVDDNNNGTITPPVIPADTTPPVITLYGDSSISIPYNGTYSEPGAVCVDDVDGALITDITGTVDVLTAGNYTMTYSCEDSAGNTATLTRTVTVEAIIDQVQYDTTRPIITLNGQSQVSLTVGDTYTDAGATCTDDTDGAISTLDDSANVDTQTPNSYTITYSCTDTSGNIATPVYRTVTVAEPQTPVTVDATLIATVQSYADETHHGSDHVDRWYRVLVTFDAITPMSVSEAQDMADTYSASRWNPIVAELQKSTASQAVIDDVISYAAETQHGADHVNRWYRVLAAFDAITPMSVSEAQDMADTYSPSRWNPIVSALKTLQ